MMSKDNQTQGWNLKSDWLAILIVFVLFVAPLALVVIVVVGITIQEMPKGNSWYFYWTLLGGGLLALAISLKEILKALSYMLFLVAFVVLPGGVTYLANKFPPEIILPIGLAFQFALIIQAGILRHIVKAREDSSPLPKTEPLSPIVDPKIIRRKPGFPPPVDELSFFSERSSRPDNEGHDP